MNWSQKVIETVQESVTAIRQLQNEYNINRQAIPWVRFEVGYDNYEKGAILCASANLIMRLLNIEEIQILHKGDDFILSMIKGSDLVTVKEFVAHW